MLSPPTHSILSQKLLALQAELEPYAAIAMESTIKNKQPKSGGKTFAHYEQGGCDQSRAEAMKDFYFFDKLDVLLLSCERMNSLLKDDFRGRKSDHYFTRIVEMNRKKLKANSKDTQLLFQTMKEGEQQNSSFEIKQNKGEKIIFKIKGIDLLNLKETTEINQEIVINHINLMIASKHLKQKTILVPFSFTKVLFSINSQKNQQINQLETLMKKNLSKWLSLINAKLIDFKHIIIPWRQEKGYGCLIVIINQKNKSKNIKIVCCSSISADYPPFLPILKMFLQHELIQKNRKMTKTSKNSINCYSPLLPVARQSKDSGCHLILSVEYLLSNESSELQNLQTAQSLDKLHLYSNILVNSMRVRLWSLYQRLLANKGKNWQSNIQQYIQERNKFYESSDLHKDFNYIEEKEFNKYLVLKGKAKLKERSVEEEILERKMFQYDLIGFEREKINQNKQDK